MRCPSDEGPQEKFVSGISKSCISVEQLRSVCLRNTINLISDCIVSVVSAWLEAWSWICGPALGTDQGRAVCVRECRMCIPGPALDSISSFMYFYIFAMCVFSFFFNFYSNQILRVWYFYKIYYYKAGAFQPPRFRSLMAPASCPFSSLGLSPGFGGASEDDAGHTIARANLSDNVIKPPSHLTGNSASYRILGRTSLRRSKTSLRGFPRYLIWVGKSKSLLILILWCDMCWVFFLFPALWNLRRWCAIVGPFHRVEHF